MADASYRRESARHCETAVKPITGAPAGDERPKAPSTWRRVESAGGIECYLRAYQASRSDEMCRRADNASRNQPFENRLIKSPIIENRRLR